VICESAKPLKQCVCCLHLKYLNVYWFSIVSLARRLYTYIIPKVLKSPGPFLLQSVKRAAPRNTSTWPDSKCLQHRSRHWTWHLAKFSYFEGLQLSIAGPGDQTWSNTSIHISFKHQPRGSTFPSRHLWLQHLRCCSPCLNAMVAASGWPPCWLYFTASREMSRMQQISDSDGKKLLFWSFLLREKPNNDRVSPVLPLDHCLVGSSDRANCSEDFPRSLLKMGLDPNSLGICGLLRYIGIEFKGWPVTILSNFLSHRHPMPKRAQANFTCYEVTVHFVHPKIPDNLKTFMAWRGVPRRPLSRAKWAKPGE
jgi:hypothetical protein